MCLMVALESWSATLVRDYGRSLQSGVAEWSMLTYGRVVHNDCGPPSKERNLFLGNGSPISPRLARQKSSLPPIPLNRLSRNHSRVEDMKRSSGAVKDRGKH